MVVLAPMKTDTFEYGEWKHGEKIVGLTNSVTAFGGKVGAAIGTAMIGWLLALGNYQENSALPNRRSSHFMFTLPRIGQRRTGRTISEAVR